MPALKSTQQLWVVGTGYGVGDTKTAKGLLENFRQKMCALISLHNIWEAKGGKSGTASGKHVLVHIKN